MEFRTLDQRRTHILQIDDARLIFRNFAGRGDKYNREGDRNFAVRIPNMEIAEQLQNDINADGVGWNVKIKDAREEGEDPFIFLKVKVKFNDRGPAIYLKTGNNVNRLSEDTIHVLDEIDILEVDLDIRAFDSEINGKPFRAAYLQSIHVVQDLSQDRFAARYANRDDEY